MWTRRAPSPRKVTPGTVACLTAADGVNGEINAFKSNLLTSEILGAQIYF